MLHCNDPACAGGDDSITAPDTAGGVGSHSLLMLDTNGNPVISYFDATNLALKILHCNDPNCAGGDESITTPDTDGVAIYTSLALDAAGNPVVSYFDGTNNDLKLLHCNDANCSGGDESITAPDTAGNVGTFTSLVLDGSGHPVVSYHNSDTGRLTLLHCNDPDCAGGDDSITVPDSTADATRSALVLDSNGNPVISYGGFSLKLLHCNDPNCAGGDDSIIIQASDSFPLGPRSLVLDAGGNPVLMYLNSAGHQLLHCNDANCAGGDDSVTLIPDNLAGSETENHTDGAYSSLVLDGIGHAVASYFHASDGDLKLLHCGDANCAKAAPTATPCPSGKVPSGAGGCGTPTPTPTPGGSEMAISVVDGDCDQATKPSKCSVPVSTTFTLSAEALVVPANGYVLAETYIQFGDGLAYDRNAALPAEEIVWPDCDAAVASRSALTTHCLSTQATSFIIRSRWSPMAALPD